MKSQSIISVNSETSYESEVNILKIVYGLHLHHTAAKAGYISRKLEYTREEYHGKFGDGYILLRPRYETQRYVTCEYWVK